MNPAAALLIVPAAEATDNTPARAYTEILFLAANNNSAQEKWTGPKLNASEPASSKTTGFDHVEVDGQPARRTDPLLPERPTVYTDMPAYGQDSHSSSGLDWLKRTNAFIPFATYQDVRPLMGSLRTFKDDREIELIRKATDASIAAHMAAMRRHEARVTEREISALMQYEWGKRGCERPVLCAHRGLGVQLDRSALLRGLRHDSSGDVVVIDAAGEYSMYATDITRT